MIRSMLWRSCFRAGSKGLLFPFFTYRSCLHPDWCLPSSAEQLRSAKIFRLRSQSKKETGFYSSSPCISTRNICLFLEQSRQEIKRWMNLSWLTKLSNSVQLLIQSLRQAETQFQVKRFLLCCNIGIRAERSGISASVLQYPTVLRILTPMDKKMFENMLDKIQVQEDHGDPSQSFSILVDHFKILYLPCKSLVILVDLCRSFFILATP